MCNDSHGLFNWYGLWAHCDLERGCGSDESISIQFSITRGAATGEILRH
jgi:hypothetical protein